MDEMEKLSILLSHWIEHTKEHAEEYLNWAKRLEIRLYGNSPRAQRFFPDTHDI